jgi:DNA-directed RNA polymerase subunit H
MHVLQPRHTKLKPQEAKLLLEKLNITAAQLPKIQKTDAALPAEAKIGDILKIERKTPEGLMVYYRVVIP